MQDGQVDYVLELAIIWPAINKNSTIHFSVLAGPPMTNNDIDNAARKHVKGLIESETQPYKSATGVKVKLYREIPL